MTRRMFAALWRLGMLAASTGQACAQDWDPESALAQPGWVWSAVQQLDPPYARISMQTFQAPVPPPEAARRLAAAAGQRLTRLQWSGSMLLLSGGQGTEHWLARLQPQAGGTAGLVSRLVPAARADTGFNPAALAPSGARQVLQVRGRDGMPPASLSSFDCPGRLDQVSAVVRRALQASGWAMAQAADVPRRDLAADAADRRNTVAPLPVDWRHVRHGRLSVHLHARARSIALTFWHHPQEPS